MGERAWWIAILGIALFGAAVAWAILEASPPVTCELPVM
jgi:hypothetical protein